jgi:branched-chain amino acid transport system ATP-binding protein
MPSPLLSASHLRVRYRNGAMGISDVSLEVDAGQTVVLLGPNGAGKSTTVRALSGFLKGEGSQIVGGSVSFDGEIISKLPPDRIARRGAMCIPERRKIFPNLSVWENLLATGRHTRRKHRAALLDAAFELFPVLKQRRGQYAGQLSGGEQQMLAIARGFMTEARLLLVDEITLGLHYSVRPILYDAISRITANGTAVLLAEESADFAMAVSDYCYIIRTGAISASGTPDQFDLLKLEKDYIG